jgi:hypothetical protein
VRPTTRQREARGIYNLLLLAGFALTGWSLAVVMHRWTGDWAGGLLAGSILAFNAHTLTRLPHLHALHFEFLPPMLLALDTLLREPRVRQGLMLALWFLLTALTSNYQIVFALAPHQPVRAGAEEILTVTPSTAARAGCGRWLPFPSLPSSASDRDRECRP